MMRGYAVQWQGWRDDCTEDVSLVSLHGMIAWLRCWWAGTHHYTLWHRGLLVCVLCMQERATPSVWSHSADPSREPCVYCRRDPWEYPPHYLWCRERRRSFTQEVP